MAGADTVTKSVLFLALFTLLVSGCDQFASNTAPGASSPGAGEMSPGEARKAYAERLSQIQDRPEDISTYLLAGDAALQANDFEAAYMAYDGAIMLSPENIQAIYGVARSCEGLGAKALAYSYYRALREQRCPPAIRRKVHAKVQELFSEIKGLRPKPLTDQEKPQ